MDSTSRFQRLNLRIAQFAAIGALILLYAYGDRIAIRAIGALSNGTETGPLGDRYPWWTLTHFVSALSFAILAMFQLVPVIRRRYLAVHRVVGRIAVSAGLLTAVSGTAIPVLLPLRPLLWRGYIVLHLAATAFFLTKGFLAARRHNILTHRAWMVRAIASAGAVMTQRVLFPLFPRLLGIHSDQQFWEEFVAASLCAWLINLLMAELWLRSQSISKAQPMASALASFPARGVSAS